MMQGSVCVIFRNRFLKPFHCKIRPQCWRRDDLNLVFCSYHIVWPTRDISGQWTGALGTNNPKNYWFERAYCSAGCGVGLEYQLPICNCQSSAALLDAVSHTTVWGHNQMNRTDFWKKSLPLMLTIVLLFLFVWKVILPWDYEYLCVTARCVFKNKRGI